MRPLSRTIKRLHSEKSAGRWVEITSVWAGVRERDNCSTKSFSVCESIAPVGSSRKISLAGRNERAGEREEAALPARQAAAVLAHRAVEPAGVACEELVGADGAQGFEQFLVGRLAPRKAIGP